MKKYIIPIIALVLIYACEDVIEVELNEKDLDLYAVEAKITTDEEPHVFLTKSLPVSVDSFWTGVSGANVIISDDAVPAKSISLTEDSDSAGYYIVPEDVDFYGEVGREYTLTIEVNDIVITASDYLARVEPIDSITVWPSLRGNLRFLAVFTYGPEPVGIGDNYKWDVYVNDTLLNNADDIFVAKDDLVDGNPVNGLEIYTDFHDPDEESDRTLKYLDTIYVKQNSISLFAYDYYLQLFNQSQGGFLFSVPPANLVSNLTSSDGKKVLGFFTAQDVSKSNSVIIDDIIEGAIKKD